MTAQKKTDPAPVPSKQAILYALRAFVAQRSGINFADYGEHSAFMGDYRPMLREGREARLLLSAIEWRDSITAEDLISASQRAFSGRLTLTTRPDGAVAVSYCTGQHFPTEYRAAVCAVCAAALWGYFRANMPAKDAAKKTVSIGSGTFLEIETYGGLSAGDWLRRQARKEFGRGIASRWFN
jgi:hypothetical protein